jgi:hypothetical protein
MTTKAKRARSRTAPGGSLKRVVSPRRGQFYNGVEWLACWLLDNAEGETITEEQLRPWAAKAWEEHLKRANDQAQPQRDYDKRS